MLFHGGGFGGGDKNSLLIYMQEFAKRGYVVVSSNYRLGWDTGGTVEPSECLGDEETLSKAIYRSVQDAAAVMRYITFYADVYGIDTAAIFIGGESAGAFTALTLLYSSQDEMDLLHPAFSSELGLLNNEGNDIEIEYSLKGVISLWGAVFSINHIDESHVPAILFVGNNDPVVPPENGNIFGCANYEFVSGNVDIANYLLSNATCINLHENSGGHVAYFADYTIPNITCFIKKYFVINVLYILEII